MKRRFKQRETAMHMPPAGLSSENKPGSKFLLTGIGNFFV
jgi:hypothetical protein